MIFVQMASSQFHSILFTSITWCSVNFQFETWWAVLAGFFRFITTLFITRDRHREERRKGEGGREGGRGGGRGGEREEERERKREREREGEGERERVSFYIHIYLIHILWAKLKNCH